jgi:hypothetical protein
MGEYEVYLKSPEWATKRRWALDRADHKCLICNSSHCLEVHHRSYDNLGAEGPNDLAVLCDGCHGLFHKHGRWAHRKRVEEELRRREREWEARKNKEIQEVGTPARLWYDPDTVDYQELLQWWTDHLSSEVDPGTRAWVVDVVSKLKLLPTGAMPNE